MVTLIPKFPLSAKCWAMELSKAKQSDAMMAEATPSWLDLGMASQIRRRRFPFNSNLDHTTIKKKIDLPTTHSLTYKQSVQPAFGSR
jgi:hypothetical protein